MYPQIVQILLLVIISINAHKISKTEDDQSNPGEPLFLTPYIERGDIEAGQRAALVKPFSTVEDDTNSASKIISYSGFLTVNKQYNSNLYFWFSPAEIDSENAPVIIWLHGGPGISSLYGLFQHHGRYYLDKNNTVHKREYYWSKIFNTIYLDNPVGTGFSFTENENGYSKNEDEIGNNLYIAMEQFFKLFPNYLKNDFYISGSSYGGKFVPALAYAIDKSANTKIKVKGLIIGNGYCDPPTIFQRSELFYQIGLIDFNFKAEVDKNIDKLLSLLKEEKYAEALHFNENITRPVFDNKTGYTSYHNYLFDKYEDDFGNLSQFLNMSSVRKNLHVGNLTFDTDPRVVSNLLNDIYQTVKPWFEYLLEKHYRILMYNGPLDLIVPYPSIVAFLRSLNWSGRDSYLNAERKLWYVDNVLAGYKKTTSCNGLTEVLVRNAGHSPSIDQPKHMYNLIQSFTNYPPKN